MQDIDRAFDDVKHLYQKFLDSPVPEFDPARLVPLPGGVDPVRFAVEEVQQLKRIVERGEQLAQLPVWMPRSDFLATEKELVFCIEVPGFESKDLSVRIVDGHLVVRGERKRFLGLPDAKPVNLERPWGPFERRFALPAGIKPEEIEARCTNGLLEIHLHTGEDELMGERKVEIA